MSTLSTESPIRSLDLLGRRGRALRQIAHFTGHHRESRPCSPARRRFHRGVQRQDVGLECDAFDDADDVDDLLRAGADRGHGLHHIADHLTAPDRDIRGVSPPAGWPAWRFSAFCRTVEASSSMLEAVSSQAWRPVLRCAATGRCCRRNLLCCRGDRFGAAAHPADDPGEFFGHTPYCKQHAIAVFGFV